MDRQNHWQRGQSARQAEAGMRSCVRSTRPSRAAVPIYVAHHIAHVAALNQSGRETPAPRGPYSRNSKNRESPARADSSARFHMMKAIAKLMTPAPSSRGRDRTYLQNRYREDLAS